MKPFWRVLAAASSACGSSHVGQQPAVTPHPPTLAVSASASAEPSGGPLFAVLETRGAGSQQVGPANDKIVIAGSDGYGRARATFVPRHIELTGCCGGPILEPEAYVAGGAVYFIDGKGVVRRLTLSGPAQVVATFAITSSHQEVSFAVSPDGSKLMAAILSFGAAGAPWTLDLELASNGGQTVLLSRRQLTEATGFAITQVVGWDEAGPIALTDAPFGTEAGWLNGQRWFGGHLSRLGLDGKLGGALGGPDCLPFAPPIAGRVICTSTSISSEVTASIRTLDGKVLFTVPPRAHLLDEEGVLGLPQDFGDMVLSPDGTRFAATGMARNADGSIVALPASFGPRGWLDEHTLVGVLRSSRAETLGVARLGGGSPRVEDWAFSGEFVGVL